MVGLNALPEECIAHILSLTTPRDAARSSAVSRAFCSASDSDAVWHKFLPPDLDLIVSTSLPPQPPPPLGPSLTRGKDVFLRLCSAPLLIDDGHKSFLLDRHSGKKCIMLSVRALSIESVNIPRSWSWNCMRNSRFAEVAEPIQAFGLEIRGTINSHMLSPGTHYAAYLVFKSIPPRLFGYEFQSLEVGAGFSGDEAGKRERSVDLSRENNTRGRLSGLRVWRFNFGFQPVPFELVDDDFDGGPPTPAPAEGDGNYPKERQDGWSEIELGEFLTSDGEDGEVETSVVETTIGNFKAGLAVEGIEIRPKNGK